MGLAQGGARHLERLAGRVAMCLLVGEDLLCSRLPDKGAHRWDAPAHILRMCLLGAPLQSRAVNGHAHRSHR